MRRLATGTALSIVALPILLAVPVATKPTVKPHPVKAAQQTLSLGSFAAPAKDVRASVAKEVASPERPDGRSTRSLLVRKDATNSFSAVAVTWRTQKGLGDVTLKVRGKQAKGWSSWRTANDDAGHTPTGRETRSGSGLVWLGPSTGVDVQVIGEDGKAPSDVQVQLINPGTSAADANPGGSQPPRDTANASHSSYPGPDILWNRAQWGADESKMTWTPEYSSTLKAGFVHHTVQATSYTPAEVPGMIRADYQYHAVTRGWGDIGYNFLVDYFGRVWQGRAGTYSRPLIGAHTGGFNSYTFGIAIIGDFSRYSVPSAVNTAISKTFAWKLAASDRDPTGYTQLTSSGGGTSRYAAGVTVTKPVIMGHRDVGSTACPGEYSYVHLPAIRTAVKGYMNTGANDGGPTGAWPLVGDQIFAYQGSARVINGSDAQASYRPYITAIQREAGAPQTGRYDSATVNAVLRWQGLVGLPKNGVTDRRTWETMAVR